MKLTLTLLKGVGCLIKSVENSSDHDIQEQHFKISFRHETHTKKNHGDLQVHLV